MRITKFVRDTIKKHFDGAWIIDPKTKKPSVSLTLMLSSVFIGQTLLVLSQIQSIGDISFRVFSVNEYVAMTAPFLGLYFGRKWVDKTSEEVVEKDVD